MNDPEARHRACWYGRRTAEIPPDIGFHTIEDGQLLYCVHPMWFPIVGYQFDVRNCAACEYFRLAVPPSRLEPAPLELMFDRQNPTGLDPGP